MDFQLVHHPGEYRGGQVTYESFSSLGVKDAYRQLCPDSDLNTEVIRVSVRKLDTILKRNAPNVHRIDILSVDVEGWELEVLEGFSLQRYRPRVAIIENLFDDPQYSEYMGLRGYDLWHTIAPNQIFLRRSTRSRWSSMARTFLRRLGFGR